MFPGSLKELVAASLQQADENLKIASASDAVVPKDFDFLSGELPKLSEDVGGEAEAVAAENAPQQSKTATLDEAAQALQLAEALDVGSTALTKLAGELAVMESGRINETTKSPVATSKVTDRLTGGELHSAGLPTNMPNYTSPGDNSQAPKNEPGKTAGWTRDKKACLAVLNTKIAQARALLEAGQADQAESMLREIDAIKKAQDPSSPQPEMPASGGDPSMPTEFSVSTGHLPSDNAGVIGLNKAQAKDPNTMDASKYLTEPPKKDNAVAAHLTHTDGQKLSAAVSGGMNKRAELQDLVSRALVVYNDPTAPQQEREKAAGILQAIKQHTPQQPAVS